MRAKVARAWLAVIACIGLIWLLAGDDFSARETSRIVDPLLRWLFPEITRSGLDAVNFGVRKVAHAVEYALLALLTYRAFRLSAELRAASTTGLALLLVLAVAGLDEYQQGRSALRTGSGFDVAIDFAGGLLAIALLLALRRAFSPRAAPAPTPREV